MRIAPGLRHTIAHHGPGLAGNRIVSRRMRRGIAAIVAVAFLVACASTNLPPIGSTANFTPEEDERRLWAAASEAEGKIIPENAVYVDGDLQRYVAEIAERLTPEAYRDAMGQGVRVRVRKDPRLNASALSHGTLVIHTGIISRAENEAQLAGILAHEIAHVTHRHHVREARAIENRRTATNVAGFLALLAVTAAAVDQANRGNYGTADALMQSAPPLLTLGLNLSFAAMVSGYARDLEREADEEGVRLMAAAGYDPREMTAMFRTMRDESGERGPIETFFWGSHPRLSERIETVERLASMYRARATPAIAPGSDFDRRVQRIRVSNAQYDAYMGRIAIARVQVSKAATSVAPADRPIAEEFFTGLTLGSAAWGARARLKDEKLANEVMRHAITSLERAMTLASPRSPALASISRTKGLMIYEWWESGANRCAAKPALERYLELRPDAPDRDTIRMKLTDLRWC
jgi:predicted Zn-dependent protease